MTRKKLKLQLTGLYLSLGMVLALAFCAKMLEIVPLAGVVPKLAGEVYQFLVDMALVIVTIAAVYLSSLLQRRSNFVERLEEEWVRIVGAKSALLTYCDTEAPTLDRYLEVTSELSIAIDTMRIAYRNVGETDDLVGLYPYAPLHNMRRAMATLHPRATPAPTDADRKRVAKFIMDSFAALRENFLEELDLQEPTTPVLRSASRRLKVPGAEKRAHKLSERQAARLEKLPPLSTEQQALQDRLDVMREIEDGRRKPDGTPV
jgi:hypothetical protein